MQNLVHVQAGLVRRRRRRGAEVVVERGRQDVDVRAQARPRVLRRHAARRQGRQVQLDRWRLPDESRARQLRATRTTPTRSAASPARSSDVQAPTRDARRDHARQAARAVPAQHRGAVVRPGLAGGDHRRSEGVRDQTGRQRTVQVAEWVRDDHITLVANPKWSGPKPGVPDRDHPRHPRSSDQRAVDPEGRHRHADRSAPRRREVAREAAGHRDRGAAVEQRQLPRDGRGEEAVRRRARAARRRVRARHRDDGEEPVLQRRGRRRQLDAAGDARRKPGRESVSARRREGASALLAAAGFPHGFATTLCYPTAPRPYLPEPQRVAETIQANLEQAGIHVTLQPYEFGVFLDKIKHGQHEMCLIGWTGDNGDPDNFFYPLLDQDSAHKDGTAQNYSFWRDPNVPRADARGPATIDDAQARGDLPRRPTRWCTTKCRRSRSCTPPCRSC